MTRAKSHKDVEFHVESKGRDTVVFKTFDEAAGSAVARAACGAEEVRIDVCIRSEAGARWYGGDDSVAYYQEDPEMSVFERIEVKANGVGRVA